MNIISDLYFYSSMLLFLSGLLSFCMGRKHLLLTLLSLEVLVISLFIFLYMYVLLYGEGFYFIMVFLTFSVCEGCLGLSILVSLIRCHGNDYLSSLSFLQW
uniref:NADH-ubiquinone oxidoreductase chain 4L n=1 Tax=Alloeorhynchus bakeri TaxID=796621 RepID=G9B4J2_9HEMI|nr:NADH dehydrogenase subunit 4L [Alloeorhynchus bakeri]ADI75228.1 NADH dehydrogenase subunit 4L [Alloeorhynchus bakeri]